MNLLKPISPGLVAGTLLLISQAPGGMARQNSALPNTSTQQTSPERDGQRDFDSLIGKWKYHLKRRLNPLTGSNTWVDLEGTGVCFKIWDGRAQLDTFEGTGPTGLSKA